MASKQLFTLITIGTEGRARRIYTIHALGLSQNDDFTFIVHAQIHHTESM